MAAKVKTAKELKKASDLKKAKELALKNVSSVDVLDPNGDFIRTYSKKVHGADFKRLADEFVSKVEGRKIIKTASKVKEVESVKEEEEDVKEEDIEEGEVE
jgi:hypothetical protein